LVEKDLGNDVFVDIEPPNEKTKGFLELSTFVQCLVGQYFISTCAQKRGLGMSMPNVKTIM